MSNSPEFDLCYNFCYEFDVLGPMTWDIHPRKIDITFYYNDKMSMLKFCLKGLI